jgi:UDP-N-acetylmuramyl pentapeptide synthase
MTFWTLERIAQALGTGPSDEREIAGITTDTRSVRTGECFVALRGERFDGHDFLADAVRAGAGALVVDDASRAPVPGVPPATRAARAAPLRAGTARSSRSSS